MHIAARAGVRVRAGNVRAAKQPLVTQRRRARAGHGERGVLPDDNSLALRLLRDGGRQVGDGQDGIRARNTAVKIGHDDGIISRVCELRAGERVSIGGCVADVRAVEKPLISKLRGSAGGD